MLLYSYKHNYYIKTHMINILCTVKAWLYNTMLHYHYILSLYLSNIAFILVLPYVIVTTTHEDFSNVPIGFPSFICTTRNSDFLVIYLLFPVIFLCSLGVFLLSIIIFNIQMVNHKRDNGALHLVCSMPVKWL